MAGVLKEVEIQMLKEMDTAISEVSTCHSSSAATPASRSVYSSSNSEAMHLPNKKSKGLSKILSYCLSNLVVQLSPQQKVKQEIDQYLTHLQLDIEDNPFV